MPTITPSLPTIGFVIVSHADPGQALRLIAALNVLYDRPPIALHHDVHQTRLDRSSFPANVAFVEPAFRTGWSKFSVVSAGLAAIGLLYRSGGPDWFFLLSAADYPIRAAAEVRAELARARCDAYLDVRPFNDRWTGLASFEGEANPKLSQFDRPANRRLKWTFFFGAQIWFPVVRRTPRWRIGRHTWRPAIRTRHPFSDRFQALYGDHWFCANRRAAAALTEATPDAIRLRRHLRDRPQGDEGYYQMILGNRSDLVICRDNKRFVEWNGGGAHPMTLTDAQLDEAFASGAFFARKFASGSPAIGTIDAALGIGGPTSV